jgi:alkylresorcinol/alkylpyrone synthase
MPSISCIGTALPQYHYNLEEVSKVGCDWLVDQPKLQALFARFLSSSKAEGRNFCIPAADIIKLNGMEHRAELFEKFGSELGTLALQSMISKSTILPKDISTLVFTSCSCPSIPSIDAVIIDRAELKRTTNRIPIYQHGCAGGVVGLRIASELSKTQGYVAVTSVELCSLVFQRENPDGAQLVGAAIFADGAASVLISPEEKGLMIKGSESYLVPDSRHLMGYDLLDDGFHLRLDRDLPRALIQVAPDRVRSFLDQYNLKPEQISHWLFHPGGTKILDFLEETFSLKQRQCYWAREILSTIGNLSSATVLFVLKAFIDSGVSKPRDKVIMLGVGPGLTLELILFEWMGNDS